MNVKESSVKMEANVLMDTMNTSVSANMDSQVPINLFTFTILDS